MKRQTKKLLNLTINRYHFEDYQEAIRILIAIIESQEERIKKLEKELENDN